MLDEVNQEESEQNEVDGLKQWDGSNSRTPDGQRTTTMTKSSQHQASVKYFLNPYAIILIIISQMKIIVNERSA